MIRFKLFAVYSAVVIFVTVLITVLAVALIQANARNAAIERATPLLVVNRVKDQSFLVSKTLYLDERTSVKVNTGSDWSDFLWGKEVNARGLVRVDLGIDFDKLELDDVKIDNSTNMITIDVAQPEILDASVTDELEITTEGSILRKLLASDPNEDYKLSSEQLIASAKTVVSEDEKLKQETIANSEKLLNYFFQDLGYGVKLNIAK